MRNYSNGEESSQYRGAMLDRCCRCIQLLSSRALTARELSKEVGFSMKSSYRYIEAISLTFPIVSTTCTSDSGHPVERFKIESLVDKEQAKKEIIKEVTKLINERL